MVGLGMSSFTSSFPAMVVHLTTGPTTAMVSSSAQGLSAVTVQVQQGWMGLTGKTTRGDVGTITSQQLFPLQNCNFIAIIHQNGQANVTEDPTKDHFLKLGR